MRYFISKYFVAKKMWKFAEQRKIFTSATLLDYTFFYFPFGFLQRLFKTYLSRTGLNKNSPPGVYTACSGTLKLDSGFTIPHDFTLMSSL